MVRRVTKRVQQVLHLSQRSWIVFFAGRDLNHIAVVKNFVDSEEICDIETLPPAVIMGITCPGAGYDSINDSLQSLLVRSSSLGNNVRSTLRSISFNGRDSEPAKLKAFGSGEFLIKESLSFNGREMDPFNLDTKISIETPTFAPDKSTKSDIPKTLRFSPLGKRPSEPTLIKPDSPKHEAAVKLQKVYKSFRTRRQLADCAVLVEQRWYVLYAFFLSFKDSTCHQLTL
ncbi:hypothetical protein B296_00033438 [Ensete ventricosum]|uniref:Uncharacterized protein n=1 Tax=Ensete ventricosum TaxID=4639 RepID=A0A426YYL6_ENSVE|nr:hypothetical protein B296_00033438 [Ensete ventricosum]